MLGETAQAILARRSAEAEANRKAMPFTAKMLDELRQHFPDARVRYAQENGRTKGKRVEGIEITAGVMVLEKKE
jgi:hypothetical protein